MPVDRRIVVTGLGVLSAIGSDVRSYWDSLAHGRSGIGPITSVDCSQLRFQNGAEVRSYQQSEHFDDKQCILLDRFSQFAIVAARAALHDAGLKIGEEQRARTGVITGSCVGGQNTMDDAFNDLYRKNLPRVNPMMIPRVMGNSGASQISMEFGFTGPTFNISTACSSSSHAIGQAFWLMRQGVIDWAVTGGSEAVFSYGFLKAWEAMRVVAPDTCRPFSKDRRGMILGEGAAMLVLETLDSAKARGANIYAEIVGFGMTSDAHHITQPTTDGPCRAMMAALLDGRVPPGKVGHINAHGTGTSANDTTESAAIRKVFDSHTVRICVTSTKSMHGHALGAAGALEAAATVLSLKHGLIPPTANFTELDPQCCIDVVAGEPRETKVEYALSNSFAFGGLNAVLAFKAPDDLLAP